MTDHRPPAPRIPSPAALLALVLDLLPRDAVVAVAHGEAAEALRRDPGPGVTRVIHAAPADIDDGSVDAVLLLGGEVSDAGDEGPVWIAEAARACRPGGIVAVAVPSRFGSGAATGLTAAETVHLLEHRGMETLLTAAPGATARLRGREWAGRSDLPEDRTAGLLDAGPVVLAAGRTPPDEQERSRRFFASIPRKVVAASVICRDAQERILVVFDSFRREWTLPGGLVDPGETPLQGAIREAREEGGVAIAGGELLGVFAHDHPDRIHLIYAGTPLRDTPAPRPLHTHEIDEVRWVTLEEADRQLWRHMRSKLHRCLEQPGRTWWD